MIAQISFFKGAALMVSTWIILYIIGFSLNKVNDGSNIATLVIKFFLGVILLVATFDLPYTYYVILRWVVLIFVLILIQADIKDSFIRLSSIPFIAILVLFNPFLPIHLKKSEWLIIDLIAAAIFFYSGFRDYKNK